MTILRLSGRRSDRAPLLRVWTIALASLAPFIMNPAAGQEANGKANAEAKPLVLFDGKGLDGWKQADYVHSGEVKVDGGAIILNTGKAMTGVTCTRKDLPRTDYELTYEARRLKGNDFFAATTFPVGKSFLTYVNGGWGGGVTGLSSLDGSDASENETNRYVKYQNDRWYKFRIRVTSEMVRCAIDDKEIIALNYKDRHVGTRIESRACQPLGFATWETTGAVRNVTIRMLTPAEVSANNKSEE
jgi:hypothetical protein